MAVIQLFYQKFWLNIKINSLVDSKLKNMALLYYKQAYSFTIAEELEADRKKEEEGKSGTATLWLRTYELPVGY